MDLDPLEKEGNKNGGVGRERKNLTSLTSEWRRSTLIETFKFNQSDIHPLLQMLQPNRDDIHHLDHTHLDAIKSQLSLLQQQSMSFQPNFHQIRHEKSIRADQERHIENWLGPLEADTLEDQDVEPLTI